MDSLVISNKLWPHYTFTAAAVIGSFALYYLLSAFTNPEITMLITFSLPVILVYGFVYSRSREIIGRIIKTNNSIILLLIGVLCLAPVGIVTTYIISRVIG